jgi:hypothetical protein
MKIVIMMRFSEQLGYYGGYLYGVFFGIGSYLRSARIFHAQGVVFTGRVESDFYTGDILLRFSSALWGYREWPDVLGLALRFGPEENPQDLLFVTTNRVFKLPFNILTSHHQDFMKNQFFSITPFDYMGERVKFRVSPLSEGVGVNRREKLNYLIGRGEAKLRLEVCRDDKWKECGQIQILQENSLEQNALEFSPFHSGLGIKPLGFVNYLRLRSYKMSQAGRRLAVGKNLLKRGKSLRSLGKPALPS